MPSKKLNIKDDHFEEIPNCTNAVLLITMTSAPATPGVIIDFPFRNSFMTIARHEKKMWQIRFNGEVRSDARKK